MPCNKAPCSDFFGGIKVDESLGTELYDHRGDSGAGNASFAAI
jgi:hypothetical protein